MTARQDGPGVAAEASVLRPLSDLPGPVRHRIVHWASETLGGMSPTDIPPALTRVARFAPAKRAKVAAAALGQTVRGDSAFRAQVAERARTLQPSRATGIDPGSTGDRDPEPGADGGGDELVTATARAYLLHLPELDDLLARLAEADRHDDVRDRMSALERQVRTLTGALERAQATLAAERSAVGGSETEPNEEAHRLRQRLREQGGRLRELQQRLDGSRASAGESLARAEGERDRALAETEVWRQRAEAAAARADVAAQNLQRLRETTGDRRSAADRRVELLLEALEGAALGLRREWDLVGGGPSPAEVVARRLPVAPSAGGSTSDPARLLAWLGLPGAHLIVDGYNVSKTGFAELSLSDQRDRLIRSLAALAARTSAEVTVVFDGAAVATARPPGRGIRVLFSAAGVLADHVIADLVRAEPRGRVVVVVSADRQVVDTATRDGGRTAPSAALLSLITG